MFFSLSRLINNAEICDKKYIIYATRKGLSLQIEILFVIYCCTKKGSFLALTLYQGSTVLLRIHLAALRSQQNKESQQKRLRCDEGRLVYKLLTKTARGVLSLFLNLIRSNKFQKHQYPGGILIGHLRFHQASVQKRGK